jgi:hypothetical protein
MGRVRKLLHNSKLQPRSDRFCDMYSFEVCEDFHLHWRNLRLQFSKREWCEFVAAVQYAWDQWCHLLCMILMVTIFV